MTSCLYLLFCYENLKSRRALYVEGVFKTRNLLDINTAEHGVASNVILRKQKVLDVWDISLVGLRSYILLILSNLFSNCASSHAFIYTFSIIQSFLQLRVKSCFIEGFDATDLYSFSEIFYQLACKWEPKQHRNDKQQSSSLIWHPVIETEKRNRL